MRSISYNFFIRTDQLTPSGKAPIYIVLIKNRKKRYFSTKLFIYPEHWDNKKRKVKKGDIRYLAYNKLLIKYEEQLFNFIFNAEIEGKDISIDTLYNFLSYGNKGADVYQFIKQIADEQKGSFAESTLIRYKSQTNKLRSFRENLFFSDITPEFIREYCSFLPNIKHNSDNTISSSLSFLKGIISKARKKGVTNIHPFNEIKIKSISGHREVLSMEELNKLEHLYHYGEMDQRHRNVLGYFLFACFTGLRFSDISALKMKDIKNSIVDTLTKKTGVWVRIPLSKRAINLLNNPHNGYAFRVISNQKTNEYLREIINTAKINKKITFHCGRHTFASRCIDLGVPLYIVAKFLGHTDIRTTEIYTQYTDNQRIREINKWDK